MARLGLRRNQTGRMMAFEPENPLEAALVSAISEPSARPEFYRLLLASELFITGRLADPAAAEASASEDSNDRLMIATIEYKQHPYHPVFTAMSRLKEFLAGEEDVQFLGMPGRQLFTATKGAQFLL